MKWGAYRNGFLCARIEFPGKVDSHQTQRDEIHEAENKMLGIGGCVVRGPDTHLEPFSTALFTEGLEAAPDFPDLNLRAWVGLPAHQTVGWK